MASISTDKKGNRTIQFVGGDARRRSIRLGKVPMRVAQAVQTRVETLNVAKVSKVSVDRETAAWVGDIDETLYEKLAAVGLVSKRAVADETTLASFIDRYLDRRTDIKKLTRRNLNQVRNDLIEYFGPNKPLAEINEGDADEFRLSLKQRLGENTVRRRCGMARQFFRAAVKRRLMAANPFGDMKGIAVQSNPSRYYFITKAEAQRVLDACPDPQWRLLFALSRFGGLRCPSEHLALRWSDIDWERGRMRVPSPKTEHHEGGQSRIVPLFPELLPHLEQAFEQAEPGTEFVIYRYRNSNSNLRTQLERIIRKAGLEPWPKLFQNLRSTRQTELAEQFPAHVVCAWIGNSEAVARKHYLQVTEEHFEQAGKSALQKAVQQPAEMDRTASHPESPSLIFAEESDELLFSASEIIRLAGFEPATYGLGNRCSIP